VQNVRVTVIGPYRLLKALGACEIGSVWSAFDEEGTSVTIAVVDAAYGQDPAWVSGLQNAANSLAAAGDLTVVSADLTALTPWVACAWDGGLGAAQLFMSQGLTYTPMAAATAAEADSATKDGKGKAPVETPPSVPAPAVPITIPQAPVEPTTAVIVPTTAPPSVVPVSPVPPPAATVPPVVTAPARVAAPPSPPVAPIPTAPPAATSPSVPLSTPRAVPTPAPRAVPVPVPTPPAPSPPRRRRRRVLLVIAFIAVAMLAAASGATTVLALYRDRILSPTPTQAPVANISNGFGPKVLGPGLEPPADDEWPAQWATFGSGDSTRSMSDLTGIGFSFRVPESWSCDRATLTSTSVRYTCGVAAGTSDGIGGDVIVRDCGDPCSIQRRVALRQTEQAWGLQWRKGDTNFSWAETTDFNGSPHYGLVVVGFWRSSPTGGINHEVVLRLIAPASRTDEIRKVANDIRDAVS
jgi:hypothetical protein